MTDEKLDNQTMDVEATENISIQAFENEPAQGIVSCEHLYHEGNLPDIKYISGWRLYIITLSVIMIWAKLSDVFGRKNTIILALITFIAASGGCGGSQALYQLIGLRCLQGLGASGIYSIGTVICFEIVPPRNIPHITTFVSIIITGSLVFGPLLGGLMNTHTTWRWIFYMNAPIGIVSLALLALLLPSMMPKQERKNGTLMDLKSLPRVDILGARFLLGLCIFSVTPLQLAINGASFGTVVDIVLFAFAGVFVIAFWEWFVTTKRELPEAVFPWNFFQDRRIVGTTL